MSFGLLALADAIERRFVAQLGLVAEVLPAELESAQGTYKGHEARLTARAYRGPQVAFARFVHVFGPEIEIVNIMCVPRFDLTLPVFGADLVGLGERGVAVADLSPLVDSSGYRAALAGVRAAQTLVGSSQDAGPLPAWAARIFSPAPLFARLAPADAAHLPVLFSPYAGAFLNAFAAASADPAQAAASGAAYRRYAEAHRQDDRGLTMMAKIFGAERARRVIEQLLFPLS